MKILINHTGDRGLFPWILKELKQLNNNKTDKLHMRWLMVRRDNFQRIKIQMTKTYEKMLRVINQQGNAKKDIKSTPHPS